MNLAISTPKFVTDRLCRKENKLKLLYSQEALFPDKVGGGGGVRTRVTNAISDVQSLQSIVAKCVNQFIAE